MICLGIESTAHSFGIGIVDSDCNVLANVSDMYCPPEGWGIHPTKAAGHHDQVKEDVLTKALNGAGVGLEEIGLVSFSQGPGLAPCLHKGLDFAYELAGRAAKPVIGVNHCIAHIEIGRKTTDLKDPITLYTSGANTQVLGLVSGRYRCFGETMDIGIGNALDKFGRGAGMGFPAGPRIEKIARGGNYIELPYVVKGMDLSFSGIITSALNKLKSHPLKDVSYSLQETVFAMLAEVTERAMAHTGKREVLLTGGVAANKRLQEMLSIMANERKAVYAVVPGGLAGDNGAMIAWTGILAYGSGSVSNKKILPRQRTDDVDVIWA